MTVQVEEQRTHSLVVIALKFNWVWLFFLRLYPFLSLVVLLLLFLPFPTMRALVRSSPISPALIRRYLPRVGVGLVVLFLLFSILRSSSSTDSTSHTSTSTTGNEAELQQKVQILTKQLEGKDRGKEPQLQGGQVEDSWKLN